MYFKAKPLLTAAQVPHRCLRIRVLALGPVLVARGRGGGASASGLLATQLAALQRQHHVALLPVGVLVLGLVVLLHAAQARRARGIFLRTSKERIWGYGPSIMGLPQQCSMPPLLPGCMLILCLWQRR